MFSSGFVDVTPDFAAIAALPTRCHFDVMKQTPRYRSARAEFCCRYFHRSVLPLVSSAFAAAAATHAADRRIAAATAAARFAARRRR